jgi:hypothetical protein
MSDISAITYYNGATVTVNATPAANGDPAGPFAALQATAGSSGTAVILMSGINGPQVTVYLTIGAIVPVRTFQVLSVSGPTAITGLKAYPAAK